jgi:hypothetical protein
MRRVLLGLLFAGLATSYAAAADTLLLRCNAETGAIQACSSSGAVAACCSSANCANAIACGRDANIRVQSGSCIVNSGDTQYCAYVMTKK